MMVHASPQFTPGQLIESGRRAESEGRLDLAVQFYRHLTEHFSEAVEAAEAYGALGRIGTVHPRPASWDGAQHPLGQRGLWRRASTRRDHYRIGRVLTVPFSVVGWLLALGGLWVAPAYVVIGAERTGLPSVDLAAAVGVSAALSVTGFAMVLAARIARAQFDQANATRELLALERAKLGLD
jgi:hypothetical protein